MEKFDRILGNTLAIFFTLLFVVAILYQVFSLMLGDVRVGNLYGGRGGGIIYSDY